MKYHCYIAAYETVYHSDVEAGSAMEAAAKAAGEHKLHGRWTVVPGEPVYVDIVERTAYEASLAGPA
jgi:hypothetical protein